MRTNWPKQATCSLAQKTCTLKSFFLCNPSFQRITSFIEQIVISNSHDIKQILLAY